MTTLDEIEKRLEAATPGPWSATPGGDIIESPVFTICLTFDRAKVSFTNAESNATFIAHAPTDIAHLLRIARAAEAWRDARDQLLAVMGSAGGCATASNALTDARAALREALEASNDQASTVQKGE